MIGSEVDMFKSSDNAPKVAVIILNWNGSRLLREFLPSVVENTPTDIGQVIVADNGSTDDSVLLLEKEFPSVEVLRFDENHGFAGGYNRAIAYYAKRYPYAVLLNSDVEVAAGWLAPLVDFMVENPNAGACQPKIRAYRRKEMFEYAGAAGGFIDRNGYPYCRGRVFSTVEEDRGQYDTPMRVFWATGACLMVDTNLYMSVGGLDESFFAHMEEIDLCWRMQLAQRSIWAVPSSTVFHLGGGSLDAKNPHKTYLNFRNNLLMLYKNLPDKSRSRVLLQRRLLDTIAWAKFMATLDIKNASAIWRAHRDFRKMKNQYHEFPADDLLNTSPRRPNILLDYYLRRRKKFVR